MHDHPLCEVCGLWITVAGWLLCALTAATMWLSEPACDALIAWIERRLHIPWLLQMFTPVVGVALMMIGWHLMCLGGQGRYPGYPLDMLPCWQQGT